MGLKDRIKHGVQSAEEAARRAASTAASTVHSATETIVDDVKNELTDVASALGMVVDTSPTEATKVDTQTGVTEQEYLNGYDGTNVGVPSRISQAEVALRNAGNSLTDHISNAISDVTSPIESYANGVHDSISDFINEIHDTGANVLSDVADIPNKIAHGISNATTGAEDRIENAVETVKTRVQAIANDLENPIRDFGHDVWDDLKYVILIGGAIGLLLWQGTKNERQEASSWIKQSGKRAFRELQQDVPAMVSKIPPAVAALPLLL